MAIVACPAGGEDELRKGRAHQDGIELTCERCGAAGERDVTPTCRLCGAQDLQGVPTSTRREHGLGEQWAPSGIRLAYYCWDCQGADVTAANPRPGPQPPPGGRRDPGPDRAAESVLSYAPASRSPP